MQKRVVEMARETNIPLGELASRKILALCLDYGVTESEVIELRREHGMTRAQRSKQKWCANRMRENLSQHSDADLALLYGLPAAAIKMIRELAS